MDVVIKMKTKQPNEINLKEILKLVLIAFCVVVCLQLAKHIADLFVVGFWNFVLQFTVGMILLSIGFGFYAAFLNRRKNNK